MNQPRPKLKKSFRVANSYQPFHTGGKLVLSADGTWLISTLNDQALVSSISTGARISLLEGDTSPVSTLSITPFPPSPLGGGYLLTAHKSYSLHIYSLPSLTLHRHIPKAHEAPIITCCSDPTGTLFATGSSDGIVKVWDAKNGNCTHVFKGHGGVISALTFDIDIEDGSGRARLVSGADDCKIRVWDLRTRECVWILESHVSVVRGLDVTDDGRTLVSGGRDKVINLWDLEKGRLRKTVPVFETLEVVGFVKEGDEERMVVFSGGDKGIIRLWDMKTGQRISPESEGGELSSKREPGEDGKTHEIVDVLYTPLTSSLTAIHIDQNIVTHSLPSLKITRQTIGYNDEVIDLTLLSPLISSTAETHLAVATNSDLIRIYSLDKFHTTLLSGHSDVVLCLSRSPDGKTLVSGSKDKTARVWKYNEATQEWRCVAKAEGHVESVGAVVVAKKDEGNFLVTASQDRTAKIWDLSSLAEDSERQDQDEVKGLRSLTTQKIHDKDINSLDISPNDKLLVSGSQDRTAKLFSIDYEKKGKNSESKGKLTQLGVFKGHKRGVWSVKFSSTDQCLATASGDRTVKLWSLGDFACIKTFEGHSNSVLRVDFITRGMQLVSCASDGLVKVWNVKDESLATTLDNHEEKVWALAIRKDEKEIVSGGADSVITFWEDVTEIEEKERVAEHESRVLKEQDFENYLSMQDYSNAILLALSLDQPRRLLKLFTEVRTTTTKAADVLVISSITGSTHVDHVIRDLNPTDLRQLMSYVKDWNTIARTAEVAQGILHAILKYHSAARVLQALQATEKKEVEMEVDDEAEEEDDGKKQKKKRRPKEVTAADVLNALIPYTERHLNRADKMVRESFIVEHLLGMMESWDQEELV